MTNPKRKKSLKQLTIEYRKNEVRRINKLFNKIKKEN